MCVVIQTTFQCTMTKKKNALDPPPVDVLLLVAGFTTCGSFDQVTIVSTDTHTHTHKFCLGNCIQSTFFGIIAYTSFFKGAITSTKFRVDFHSIQGLIERSLLVARILGNVCTLVKQLVLKRVNEFFHIVSTETAKTKHMMARYTDRVSVYL